MPRLAESTRTARREQILTAALTCFARAGFHATTMADIATQAGLAKGTPYLYLASKEQLYAALRDTWECALVERTDAAVEQMSRTVVFDRYGAPTSGCRPGFHNGSATNSPGWSTPSAQESRATK